MLSGISEFRIVPNAPLPVGITAGPDGSLWFTESGAGKIGRVSTAGSIAEFTLPRTDSDPEGIVAGPDGALWFTEFGIDRIGRISTAGAITEFALAPNSGPRGITAGPGELWFTESAADRIGRITTAGVITEFNTGITRGSTPTGIAFGPDNNFWFTEADGDRIGRITPAGVVTEFSTGIASGSRPTGIAAGPAGDGSLWFTMSTGNRVGRITTAGAVSVTTGISANSTPTGITLGPDDNLWITENSGNRIARIISIGPSQGTVTEFSSGIVANGGLRGIVTGPDGKLWFTEARSNRIGVIVATGPNPVTEFRLRSGNSGPTDVTLGPDLAVWYTDARSAKIGRVSPTGAISEFTLARNDSDPEGITTGPDSNLWFTEFGLDRIGRITPAGVITEFTLSPNTAPRGITSGPDGALWFTEQAADRVGRLTTAGVITNEFALSRGGNAESITTGPDGALWITEPGVDKVARVTTAGTVSEFLLASGRTPAGITKGPAGTNSIWFAESGGNRIGRISTAGDLTEFTVPTANSRPLAIALGVDGNLWFTETTANQIGRITPSGVITEFRTGLTPNSGPRRITPGSNATLWFSESQSNRLGQVAQLLAVTGTLNATEGQVVTGPIATFIDGDVRAVAANYRVTINWGDGTPVDTTTAVVTATNSSNGSFSIAGTHTFADEGSFSVSVTIQDTTNTTSLGTAQVGSSALVADAALKVTSVTVNPVEGVAFTGTVATFTDANPNATVKDFTATITWGDGQTSTGTIAASTAGGFTVTGTHTFAEEGSFNFSVQIQDVGGSTATDGRPVVVADTALTAVGVPVTVATGIFATNLPVATFTVAGVPDPVSNFTATVNWGDGSDPSLATISFANGVFTVSGNHTFSGPGKFSIVTTIRSAGGSSVSATTTALVGDVNQRFVGAIYLDLFQRTVDSSGLMFWTMQLQQGVSRSQVVLAIESGLEYRTLQVQRQYQLLLKRAADPGGLASSIAFLMNGGTLEQLGAVIAGSPEYFQVRGGGTNSGFLTALFQDLLKRPIDTNGQTGFTQALSNGATRVQVVAAVLASPEYRQLLVQGYYQQFLLRNADPIGLSGFVTALQNGARDEQVIATFLSSAEYASVRVGS